MIRKTHAHLAAIALGLALPALSFAQSAAPAQTPTPTPSVTPSTSQAAPEAAYKRADANGDNKLSKAEAARLPAIAAKFDELDKDKDGSLSAEEFMAGSAK